MKKSIDIVIFFFNEPFNPNSAGLLNVAWLLGGGHKCAPIRSPKNWKFIINQEKSRNFGHPDPLFHGEIAIWKMCWQIVPPHQSPIGLMHHEKWTKYDQFAVTCAIQCACAYCKHHFYDKDLKITNLCFTWLITIKVN